MTAMRLTAMAALVALTVAGCARSEPEPAESVENDVVANVAVENFGEPAPLPEPVEVTNAAAEAPPPPAPPVQEPEDIAADADATGMTARLPSEDDSQPANAAEE